MMKSKIVTNCMSQISSQNVRLKDVNVDRDADSFTRTNCSHGGNCRTAIFKRLAPKWKKGKIRKVAVLGGNALFNKHIVNVLIKLNCKYSSKIAFSNFV